MNRVPVSRPRGMPRQHRTVCSGRAGGVSIVAAFLLLAMLFAGGVCVEASYLYILKQQSQRASDLADLAGANTTTPVTGSSPGSASSVAVDTAGNVAYLNGVTTTVTTTAVASPVSGDTNSSLLTAVQLVAPSWFGKFISNNASLPVTSSTYVDIMPTSGGCVVALHGALSDYGAGTNVYAPKCDAAADTYLLMNACTGLLTIQQIAVGVSQATQNGEGCATGVTSALGYSYNASITDTLASNPVMTTLASAIASETGAVWPFTGSWPAEPAYPTPTTGATNFSQAGTTVTLPQGCYRNVTIAAGQTVTVSGGTQCGVTSSTANPPDTSGCASYAIAVTGTLSMSGTSKLILPGGCTYINTLTTDTTGTSQIIASGPAANIDFAASFTLSGVKSLDVDPASGGSVALQGSVTNAGTGTLSFGTVAANGTLSNSPTENFYEAGSPYNSGSGILQIGNGPCYIYGTLTNGTTGQVIIGNGPIYIDGSVVNNGPLMKFGDGPFYLAGTVTDATGSGILEWGVGNVFVNGTMSFHGSNVIFGWDESSNDPDAATTGAGTILLAGTFSNYGSSNIKAIGYTWVVAGSVNFYGSGQATVTAPTAANPACTSTLSSWNNPYCSVTNVLLDVTTGYGGSGAISIYSSNSNNVFSGLIYNALGNSSIYGAQSINLPAAISAAGLSASSTCLELASSVIDIYSGTAIDFSTCPGLSESIVASTPKMVQ